MTIVLLGPTRFVGSSGVHCRPLTLSVYRHLSQECCRPPGSTHVLLLLLLLLNDVVYFFWRLSLRYWCSCQLKVANLVIGDFSTIFRYRRRLLEITVWAISHPLPLLRSFSSFSLSFFHPLPPSFFLSYPSPSFFYLSFRPLNPARESGERCKLPQRVRAEPGRQTFFGAFWGWNCAHFHLLNGTFVFLPRGVFGMQLCTICAVGSVICVDVKHKMCCWSCINRIARRDRLA